MKATAKVYRGLNMSDLFIFGTGYDTDAPSGTTFQTQFAREAPALEARRLALNG